MSIPNELLDKVRYIAACERLREKEQRAKAQREELISAREEITRLRVVIAELNKIPKPINYVRNESVYEMGMRLKGRFPIPYLDKDKYKIDPQELHGFIDRVIDEMSENK